MIPIITEGPRYIDIDVWHGEDWFDELPAFTLFEGSDDPLNMSGVRLELIARPSFNNLTRFILLTSSDENGILRDDPQMGLFSFYYPRTSVEADLPLTTTAPWKQFLTAFWSDPIVGAVSKHIWTGDMIVHPARRAVTI